MKQKIREVFNNFKKYIKRLLFPLYLFPIKLLTYSTYYILRFVWKVISWPFKKWSNFGKTILWFLILIYFLFSLLVIFDYINREYGNIDKFLCGPGVKSKLQNSVVRIIGGYGEGSGFFISPNRVLTNFHVIANEASPKIVFADGHFETPDNIVGNKDMDIALLTLSDSHPEKVYELPDGFTLLPDEPVLSAGYPLGSDVIGNVTVVKGNFIDFRRSSHDPVGYLQTDISLVEGMSGGPLVDQCGNVVGVNTLGLAGLSFFITASDVKANLGALTDEDIKRIEVDPTKSPEDAVYAFYTYLKARRMTDGYNLLSSEYLNKTDYTEWTNRFNDILDVRIYLSERFEKSKTVVFVKFSTQNWVNGELEWHFYEGTWETVNEEGTYKMNKSKIVEVDDPDYFWFYE